MTHTHWSTLTHLAIDLDGPLLSDSFSPIMVRVAEHYGWDYTAEFERNTLSRNRNEVSGYLRGLFERSASSANVAMQGMSNEAMTASYFEFRKQHLAEHPIVLQPGVAAFIQRFSELGLTLVCYGGLDESYMREQLGVLAGAFDSYVCTNEFRPGVREIVERFCPGAPTRIAFVDDVCFVGEHARQLGTGFIGLPSLAPSSWQRRSMQDAGLPCIVDSLDDIDAALAHRVDQQLASGHFWASPQTAAHSRQIMGDERDTQARS